MTRINCHSSLRHYEMFHSGGCGGGNYGSIFNTTYNINCGGHGGFWSGVGYGFGNMLGGMFGGMFNGGGMFSMGNMFGGFSFPSFGGSFGNLANWSNLLGGSNKKTSGNCNCNCNCGSKSSVKSDDTDASEAKSTKKPSKTMDDANATKDTTEVKAPTAKAAEVTNNATDSTKEKEPVENTKVASSKDVANAAENKPASTESTTQNEPSVKIDGKDITFKDLKPDDILKLTKDQIAKLNQDQANQLLDKLNIKEDEPVTADMLTNKAALRLLALAGRRVKLAENTNPACNDKFIWGTVGNVSDDDSKPVSYTVDCNNEVSTHKNTYQFTQTALNEKSFKVTVTKFAEDSKYKDEKNVKEVTFSAEGNNKYLTRNGKAFLTK